MESDTQVYLWFSTFPLFIAECLDTKGWLSGEGKEQNPSGLGQFNTAVRTNSTNTYSNFIKNLILILTYKNKKLPVLFIFALGFFSSFICVDTNVLLASLKSFLSQLAWLSRLLPTSLSQETAGGIVKMPLSLDSLTQNSNCTVLLLIFPVTSGA